MLYVYHRNGNTFSISNKEWRLITLFFRDLLLDGDGIIKCIWAQWTIYVLTHRGRVTHICVSKLTTIGSDNGLSPRRHQAIIWTNAGILLIRTLEKNFSDILIQIHTFSNKKMHLKMSSGKYRPFCLGLNVLIVIIGLRHVMSSARHGNAFCSCNITVIQGSGFFSLACYIAGHTYP